MCPLTDNIVEGFVWYFFSLSLSAPNSIVMISTRFCLCHVNKYVVAACKAFIFFSLHNWIFSLFFVSLSVSGVRVIKTAGY